MRQFHINDNFIMLYVCVCVHVNIIAFIHDIGNRHLSLVSSLYKYFLIS